jgi:uncharacterized protein (DUF362 family)
MPGDVSRRRFFQLAAAVGAAAHVGHKPAAAQTASQDTFEPVFSYNNQPTVAVISGEQRRKIVHDALVAIEDDIRPVLKRKKYVVIKPNNVSTVNPLAATNADTLRGILDFLEPRFKGPVVIAESSAGDTLEAYENFKYTALPKEYRRAELKLVDLNREAKYEVMPLLSPDLHVQPVRLAARLLDPDAFVICAAIMKTHNTVVATLSIKNMVLGAPLHYAPSDSTKWNDKRKYHGGVRQTHYNMYLTAQKMKPFWGATVIDGFEGMEGNGPSSGTPVPSRIAIASTDYVAADRVALEAMSIDPSWVGYLIYCGQVGLGQYDLSKINVQGAKLSDVKRPYRMHRDIERELEWRGPLTEVPPKLG